MSSRQKEDGTKVSKTSSTRLKQGRVSAKKTGKVEGKGSVFLEELGSVQEAQEKKVLDGILRDVDEVGRILIDVPTYPNLLQYKEKVKEFMEEVLERLYRSKERIGRSLAARQKVYTLIERIDQELDSLTEELLKSQSKQIDLASKVDGIRGMLVDLYS
ncbi:MAG: YaaR family protein [bacterium]|nr:YaaR family protein [bacterium]